MAFLKSMVSAVCNGFSTGVGLIVAAYVMYHFLHMGFLP